MSVLKTAVLRQIAYARSVRSVIRAIMRRMLDGEWINRIFASSDEEFNNRLDEAFKSLDLANATKRDFCGAVVDVRYTGKRSKGNDFFTHISQSLLHGSDYLFVSTIVPTLYRRKLSPSLIGSS